MDRLYDRYSYVQNKQVNLTKLAGVNFFEINQ